LGSGQGGRRCNSREKKGGHQRKKQQEEGNGEEREPSAGDNSKYYSTISGFVNSDTEQDRKKARKKEWKNLDAVEAISSLHEGSIESKKKGNYQGKKGTED